MSVGGIGRNELSVFFREEFGGLGCLRVVVRVGVVVGWLVVFVGFVSRMVGVVFFRGWFFEWEDVVVMVVGRGCVGRRFLEWGVVVVVMMVEMVFVGGCLFGWGVIVVGVFVCEKGLSGWRVSVITEVGVVVTDECLVELSSVVIIVFGVVFEGRI